MICPNCKAPNLIVLESRSTLNDTGIRRRRKCENCNHLLTTYELQENDLPKRFFREKGRLYIVKAAARRKQRTQHDKTGSQEAPNQGRDRQDGQIPVKPRQTQ